MLPTTHYAKSGGVNIAYQTIGNGPRDLVLVPGWVSNLDVFWEEPGLARMLSRLASFSRLIMFDKRGTGLSDRVTDMPSLEVRMDDVRAVMDAVGSQHAALFGYSEGGAMCALFAATYPDRATALIMGGAFSRRIKGPDYPWGPTREQALAFAEEVERNWGGTVGIEQRWPSKADDERCRHWWAHWLRSSASPAAAAALLRMNMDIDIRHVLPAVRVPTLILHSRNERLIDFGASQYMCERISGAKLVELHGIDHIPWGCDCEVILDEVEEFLTGVRSGTEPERLLVTVMFTDIVGATERAAALGDRGWNDLLQSHHAVVRRELAHFRGREIDTAGDGFLATFDGPARAVRCACAISREVRALGLEIRAGLHTGECEVIGDKVAGIAVHTGARVANHAQTGEVLVSGTVRDLVAGSGLSFQDRGMRRLKGNSDEWRLFAVEH
ncbi:adenylate/guanylate cyclase domain-containing protein [Variovorax sp. J22R24]|uniref:adenylate/guanylate cyclase domain-containing protein n=1 Tax=Variovorax gracilis TaxID=3053502 RepID=UPI002578FE1E|nr:adenylate/guanylate cyclase domain-containing protein [Variovorax sp. J22R24]MDM0108047.1 adenylate/guanylate cyclase domain-containing protein [Variovorax sp. J22R24]